jgi:hypothetical protein
MSRPPAACRRPAPTPPPTAPAPPAPPAPPDHQHRPRRPPTVRHDSPPTDTSTTDTDTTTGTTTTDDTSSTGDTTNVEPCACPDLEVALDDGIFVLSDDAELWKFYPETKSSRCSAPSTAAA